MQIYSYSAKHNINQHWYNQLYLLEWIFRLQTDNVEKILEFLFNYIFHFVYKLWSLLSLLCMNWRRLSLKLISYLTGLRSDTKEIKLKWSRKVGERIVRLCRVLILEEECEPQIKMLELKVFRNCPSDQLAWWWWWWATAVSGQNCHILEPSSAKTLLKFVV